MPQAELLQHVFVQYLFVGDLPLNVSDSVVHLVHGWVLEIHGVALFLRFRLVVVQVQTCDSSLPWQFVAEMSTRVAFEPTKARNAAHFACSIGLPHWDVEAPLPAKSKTSNQSQTYVPCLL